DAGGDCGIGGALQTTSRHDYRRLNPKNLAGCGKKEFPPPAPSLWSLPVGREVKESSHLLCRVRSGRIRPGTQPAFFRTLLGAGRSSAPCPAPSKRRGARLGPENGGTTRLNRVG